MKVTPLDEMVETFKDVALTDPRTSIKTGLRAVIEKHIGPLMLKACGQAMACAMPEDYQGVPEEQAVAAMKREHEVAASIVSRIISQLTEQEKEGNR